MLEPLNAEKIKGAWARAELQMTQIGGKGIVDIVTQRFIKPVRQRLHAFRRQMGKEYGALADIGALCLVGIYDQLVKMQIKHDPIVQILEGAYEPSNSTMIEFAASLKTLLQSYEDDLSLCVFLPRKATLLEEAVAFQKGVYCVEYLYGDQSLQRMLRQWEAIHKKRMYRQKWFFKGRCLISRVLALIFDDQTSLPNPYFYICIGAALLYEAMLDIPKQEYLLPEDLVFSLSRDVKKMQPRALYIAEVLKKVEPRCRGRNIEYELLNDFVHYFSVAFHNKLPTSYLYR